MPRASSFPRALAALLCAGVVSAACGAGPSAPLPAAALRAVTSTVPSTTIPAPTTTTVPPLPQAAVGADGRSVLDTRFRPFLSAGGLILDYPTPFVERVGFHESTLAGARDLDVLASAGETLVMPSRSRLTPANTAADVLSDPNAEVRAPVTGQVRYGGTYVLYCKYTDSFLIIVPDAHPTWQVKLLHISGLTVRIGQRVEAGVTQVAAHPTRLPFASQVEDYSTKPVWPHVHVEVDDPSIKNPPGVGGNGCN
jgi:hypothetical protein